MNESENLPAQVQEIDALRAIYQNDFKTEDEANRTYNVTVTENGHSATLGITLPSDYPSHAPPYYSLTAYWMKGRHKDAIYDQLESIYHAHAGGCVLHLWIEKLREYLRVSIPADNANLLETAK